MTQLYRSAGWSIQVPDGWTATEEDGHVAFRAEPPRGVLHVSAARKDGPVTDEDVAEFARDRLGEDAELRPASLGHFRGGHARYEADGECWREWWVYRGSLMLYATYTVDLPLRGTEDGAVDGMLASLRPA